MAKLTVKLKQHTPLIHFEHELEGATLRATELKPKLNKFLTEHVFDWNFYKFKDFLIGDINKYKKNKNEIKKLNPAFDYKVNIRVKKEDRIANLDIEDFKLYFGNMGDGKDKNFSFYKKIELKFFSFNQELIKLIDGELSKFLLVTNFGTRQGKGFGSFYREYEYNEEYLNEYYDYLWTSNRKNIVDVFKDIDREYKKLRNGGKNNPKIKDYFDGIDWEKIKINRELIRSEKPKEAFIIRDLLGLATTEDWQKFGILKKESIADSDIQRFQSPIFFKIIEKKSKYCMYIKLNRINITNKEFNLYFNENKKIKISTPETFDIYDFFDYARQNGAFSSTKKAGDK